MAETAAKDGYPRPMSPKMAVFAQEFPVDLNQTRAALRAGYSPKTAKEMGHQLMRDPRVKAAIDAAMAERAKRVNIDQDFVILKLRDILDACLAGTPILDAKGNDTGFSKIDSAGANRAAELLGKNQGMFKDQVDHTVGLRLTHEDALALLGD